MGRLLVRSTLASKSRSHKSFTVQPAPRSSSAPAPNNASSLTSGKAPGGLASAIDQKQGHARSHVPACMCSKLFDHSITAGSLACPMRPLIVEFRKQAASIQRGTHENHHGFVMY